MQWARCGGDLDLTGPIPASCPKWPGHKLSWKKQDWETSGNASFFKPSHTKKKYHSDYLLSIIVIIITIIIILIDFPKQNPLFWETMILQIRDNFSQILHPAAYDSGGLTSVPQGSWFSSVGGRFWWMAASLFKANCFCVDMTIRKFETNTIFCVDAIFCENKSLVPSCLVSSTFGCPQYPQTTWRFD